MVALPKVVRIPLGGRKKSDWVPATRWFRNGDHPLDGIARCNPDIEGSVVRRFRRPDVDGSAACPRCHEPYDAHGFIDEGGGLAVCPGSYVANRRDGTHAVVTAEQVVAQFKDETPGRKAR